MSSSGGTTAIATSSNEALPLPATTKDDNNENEGSTAKDTNGNALLSTFLQPTTNPLSEKRLAQTLGYPSTWHVVRTISSKHNTFSDRIYAGPPSSNPDTYYNHVAAMNAALNWIEGKSTPHDDDGGQLNPREALFEREEYVEVYYDPDDMWYGATIKKVVVYQDDIRYTVLYKADGATQTNVAEELIRKAEKPKPKKRKKSTTPAAKEGNSKKKQKKDAEDEEMEEAKGDVDEEKSEGKITSYFSSNQKHKIHRGRSSKKTSSDDENENATDDDDAEAQNETPKESAEPNVEEEVEEEKPLATPGESEEEEDYGDPPWRTTNHKYLFRTIRYPLTETITQFGTVTGWISKMDKDKEGNPGFVSDVTGKPAALFHVVFGGDYENSEGVDVPKSRLLQSQDLEEEELLEFLVDGRKRRKQLVVAAAAAKTKKKTQTKKQEEKGNKEGEEVVVDEDDIPLSSMIAKKEKNVPKKRGRPRKKK